VGLWSGKVDVPRPTQAGHPAAVRSSQVSQETGWTCGVHLRPQLCYDQTTRFLSIIAPDILHRFSMMSVGYQSRSQMFA
jgi:hypothetical protein